MTHPRRGHAGRTGRRGGESGTRDAILSAARHRFGEHGYDGATIRAIAADAGVDAALVYHFFGSKERLFASVMRLPIIPGDVVEAALAAGARDSTRSPGEHLVLAMLTAWDQAEMRSTFLGLLRSALTSEQAAVMLRQFVADTILGRVALAARSAGADVSGDARYRASLVGSQVVGLVLARYVLQVEPLATASPAELAAAVGPTLDRYLTGDIG